MQNFVGYHEIVERFRVDIETEIFIIISTESLSNAMRVVELVWKIGENHPIYLVCVFQLPHIFNLNLVSMLTIDVVPSKRNPSNLYSSYHQRKLEIRNRITSNSE